jgi:hypothetical protein
MYSSTNKGGLSRKKSSPPPPIRGLRSVASWPRVFPRRISDSLHSRFDDRYDDLHHSTNRALRDNLYVRLATPFHQRGWSWLQKIIGTVPASFTYTLGIVQWTSPVISEISARADQRQRKLVREADPNHSRRDRPRRILGMAASLISLCPK